MTISRRCKWLLSAVALAVLPSCSSTGHTPVSDYPLVPPTDLASAAARPDATAALDGPAEGQSAADWTATWIDGPASAFATEEEVGTYQQLDGTGARSEFIRRFWQRRTPPPSSNSQRAVDVASERTLLAEELFGGEGMAGWRTPFGRALSILGTPATIGEGKLRSGPRTNAGERLWARRGDQVLWQYGREPARAEVVAHDVFTAPHFVIFLYWVDGWSLRCGDGWIAGSQFPGPDPSADIVESPVSPDTSDRALANPFLNRGTKASSNYSDGQPPRHVRRFGPACLELFERVRSGWLTSALSPGPAG